MTVSSMSVWVAFFTTTGDIERRQVTVEDLTFIDEFEKTDGIVLSVVDQGGNYLYRGAGQPADFG